MAVCSYCVPSTNGESVRSGDSALQCTECTECRSLQTVATVWLATQFTVRSGGHPKGKQQAAGGQAVDGKGRGRKIWHMVAYRLPVLCALVHDLCCASWRWSCWPRRGRSRRRCGQARHHPKRPFSLTSTFPCWARRRRRRETQVRCPPAAAPAQHCDMAYGGILCAKLMSRRSRAVCTEGARVCRGVHALSEVACLQLRACNCKHATSQARDHFRGPRRLTDWLHPRRRPAQRCAGQRGD